MRKWHEVKDSGSWGVPGAERAAAPWGLARVSLRGWARSDALWTEPGSAAGLCNVGSPNLPAGQEHWFLEHPVGLCPLGRKSCTEKGEMCPFLATDPLESPTQLVTSWCPAWAPRPDPQCWFGRARCLRLCQVSALPFPPTAIALLKDREPGAFIIRDSHSFRGAYGLAMKVASPPPTVMQQNKKGIVRPPASHAGMLAIVRPRTSGQEALLSSDVPLSMR